MPLTKAQCPNCGGALEVDASKEAAVCPFCNTPYIVEKAINIIHFDGPSVTNLLLRAKTFEKEGLIEQAYETYSKVLDIDITNEEANEGLKRLAAIPYIGTIPVSNEIKNEIKTLVAMGQKMRAIKAVRRVTGYSLVQAITFIDNYVNGEWLKFDL